MEVNPNSEPEEPRGPEATLHAVLKKVKQVSFCPPPTSMRLTTEPTGAARVPEQWSRRRFIWLIFSVNDCKLRAFTTQTTQDATRHERDVAASFKFSLSRAILAFFGVELGGQS